MKIAKVSNFLVMLLVCWRCLGADESWVEYKDGLLSVDFEAVELESALEETSVAANIGVSVDASVKTKPISRRFDGLPLEQGIRRLLQGYNFIMLFADDGAHRVERVMVLGAAREHSAPSVMEPRPPGRGPEDSAPEDESNVSESAPQNPLVELLQGASEAGDALVLRRHRSGHYITPGAINSSRVSFLVDTGATVVALPERLARRLRLKYGARRTVETANGRTAGYETLLGSVTLGELRMERVPAVILPGMKNDDRVLLGMSFLEGFDLVQSAGTLIIRSRPAAP